MSWIGTQPDGVEAHALDVCQVVDQAPVVAAAVIVQVVAVHLLAVRRARIGRSEAGRSRGSSTAGRSPRGRGWLLKPGSALGAGPPSSALVTKFNNIKYFFII